MSSFRKNKYLIYLPLLLTIFIDSLGVGIVYPVFATVFSTQGGGYFPNLTPAESNLFYGLTIGAFPIAMIFGSPLIGDLSDQKGRKKILMFCLIGEGCGMFLMGISLIIKSVILIIFARAITGLLAGSIGLAQAAIIDVSSKQDKTVNLSLVSLAASLGFSLGPWFGGFASDIQIIGNYGYTAPFFIATIMAIGNAILLWYTFSETFKIKEKKKLSILRGFTQVFEGFSSSKIRNISIILFLIQSTYCMFFQSTALSLTNNFHYTLEKIGHFMSLLGLIYAISLLIIVRLLVKFLSNEDLLKYSLLLVLVGFAISIPVKIVLVWLSAIPTPIGIGLAYMAAISIFSNFAPPEKQGWIMGIAASVSSAGWGVGSILCGVLTAISFHIVYILITVMIIINMFIIFRTKFPKTSENSNSNVVVH